MFALALSACSAAPPPKQDPIAERERSAAESEAQQALTMENLLRWASQGAPGWDKVSAAMNAVFALKALPGESLFGKGPVRLSDGRVLSLVSIGNLTRQIDIGVSSEPCVSPTWVANIVGARLNPVHQDAHGIDRGQQYDATANGMFIRLNTTPVSYRCVTAIHIYPAPKEGP